MNNNERLMYEMFLELDRQDQEAEKYMLELLEQAEEEYEEIEMGDAWEEEEMYPLDPFFPDDEYLDPNEVWELSAEAYGDD